MFSTLPLRERLTVIGLSLLDASDGNRAAAAAALIGIVAVIGRRLPAREDRHKISKLLADEGVRLRWNGETTRSGGGGEHATNTVA